MNQSFYVGALGAQQQMLRMNVQGSNIANVNTYGFRAEKARFTNLIYQNLLSIHEEEELPVGVGARMLMTSTDFNSSGVLTTGRPLDHMIEGEGFFGLVDLATNEVSFTRNGAFTKSSLRRATGEDAAGNPIIEEQYYLSDGEGRFVLSNVGELIPVPAGNNEDMEALPIGVFDFTNYDGMAHLADTRFLPVEKNGNLWLGNGIVRQGVLELSNVDLADEITKVIEAQRTYSMALKMVQTSDEIETTINSLRS